MILSNGNEVYQEVKTRRIVLDRFKIAAEQYLSRDVFLQDEKLESFIDHSVDAMVLRLRAYCLGKKQETARVYFPSSWWQHLKRDHAPKWFKQRFPVKETVFTYESAKLCPHINIKFQDNQQVHFEFMEKP